MALADQSCISFGTQLGDIYDLAVSREDRSWKDAGHLAFLFGRESRAVDYHEISCASSFCSLGGLDRSRVSEVPRHRRVSLCSLMDEIVCVLCDLGQVDLCCVPGIDYCCAVKLDPIDRVRRRMSASCFRACERKTAQVRQEIENLGGGLP